MISAEEQEAWDEYLDAVHSVRQLRTIVDARNRSDGDAESMSLAEAKVRLDLAMSRLELAQKNWTRVYTMAQRERKSQQQRVD